MDNDKNKTGAAKEIANDIVDGLINGSETTRTSIIKQIHEVQQQANNNSNNNNSPSNQQPGNKQPKQRQPRKSTNNNTSNSETNNTNNSDNKNIDTPNVAQQDGSPQSGKRPHKADNIGNPGRLRNDEPADICGAHNKRGSICKLKAGFGTDHVGFGRCKFHGGCSKGVKGNKNALKTGEYETFYYDLLTDDEKVVYQAEKMEKEEQVKNELRLLSIRERRMLERVNELKELLDDGEQYVETDITHQVGDNGGEFGGVDMVTQKREHLHTRLLAFEAALTRVQNVKAKLIEILHKIDIEKGDTDNGALDKLAEVLQRAHQKYDIDEPEGED